MGSVWAARNELTLREFAIKFLRPDVAQNSEAIARFFREARASGQIKHPAVVEVYDMGQTESDSPYIVMELLEGEGLDQRLGRVGVHPGEAAVWLAFVARGLAAAHASGLIHRDLKPGNVFLVHDAEGDPVPKILDFGISKSVGPGNEFLKTSTGAVMGSPAYMSPEQARGDLDIDGRSDIWSLGVILYEALTGRLPFDGPNYNALMMAIITKPHRPASEVAPFIPADLSAIVDRALSKDRAHRFATAIEFAEHLEGVAVQLNAMPLVPLSTKVTGLFQSVRPPAPAVTQGTWAQVESAQTRRRPKAMLLAGGVVTALLLAVGVVAVVHLRSPQVAIAGRSAAALESHMAELRGQLDRIASEARAEAEAKERASTLVLEPNELPTIPHAANAPRAPIQRPVSTRPASGSSEQKRSKDDPHGGVDSAGF